jgi:hypothetical protein
MCFRIVERCDDRGPAREKPLVHPKVFQYRHTVAATAITTWLMVVGIA